MTTATVTATATAYRGFTWEVRGGDLYVQADHEGALAYALATGREWNPALVAMDEAALRRQIDEMHEDSGSGAVFDGAPQKFRDGTWGVKIMRTAEAVREALPAAVKVRAKSGKEWTAVIGEVMPGHGAPAYVRTVRITEEAAAPKPAAPPKAKAKAAAPPRRGPSEKQLSYALALADRFDDEMNDDLGSTAAAVNWLNARGRTGSEVSAFIDRAKGELSR